MYNVQASVSFIHWLLVSLAATAGLSSTTHTFHGCSRGLLCAELLVSLRPGLLWLVVFDLHSILHLFCLYIAQLLSLHNVAEITSIAIALEFLQQVQLVLLKLLDSRVQA